MKHILILIAVISLMMTGCGSDKGNDEKTSGGDNTAVTETSSEAADKEASKDADSTDSQADESEKVNVDDIHSVDDIENISGDQLEALIDEFNTTEDPERKEELRIIIEAILSQADGETIPVE